MQLYSIPLQHREAQPQPAMHSCYLRSTDKRLYHSHHGLVTDLLPTRIEPWSSAWEASVLATTPPSQENINKSFMPGMAPVMIRIVPVLVLCGCQVLWHSCRSRHYNSILRNIWDLHEVCDFRQKEAFLGFGTPFLSFSVQL